MPRYYNIKKEHKDFEFILEFDNTRGSRPKRTAYCKDGLAMFKYQKYNCSEACSEKLSYEIASILGYKCAKIEFAEDENDKLGVLNYYFIDQKLEEHMDAISYIKKEEQTREEFHTIENIKTELDKLDKKLFFEFLKILVFDTLVGEQDRHEENWGLTVSNGKYELSPLYDNGCNLLREFYDAKFAEKYYNGEKDFEAYIDRSKTLIYKSNRKVFKHFELIKYLYERYPKNIEEEIKKLQKLTDKKIETIVNKIPKGIITDKHKEYIIKYLKIRKQKLLDIIERGK